MTTLLRRAQFLAFVFAAVFVFTTALAQPGGAATSNATAATPAIRVPQEFRQRPLRVVTRVIEPFAMSGNNGIYQGFSIDLWNAVAAKLGLQTQYSLAPTVEDLLQNVQTGKADVGIAAVSITSAREELIDFSQPMYQSGLQIAVRAGKPSSLGELSAIWGIITAPTMLHLIGLMLICAIVIAHVVWLIERRHEEGGVVEHKRYFPGIFKAFWWSLGTIGSQVDEMPRTWLGRTLALFWMFCAIVFVAYFTAAATSTMTVSSLRGGIQGPGDLPGKRVATTAGSTAAAYLKTHGANVLEVATTTDAWKLLQDNGADAVVLDAPVAQYYAANAGNGQVATVGDVFQKEYYGIVFPDSSSLRGPVNEALLQLIEDGTYQSLQDKWFKPPASSGN